MVEVFLQGALDLFAPTNFFALFVGVLVGLFIGLIPAIGAIVGISLLLPVVYVLSPEVGLLFLIGLYSVVMTTGSIPAILMRVPGSPTNIVTTIDGYPMAQKGEGARALGAALTSSALGGILSVPMAMLMIPVIIPVVLAMKSPETALLILVGLSFLAVLGAGDKIKNLVAGFMGILVSLIGLQHSTGVYRYTFGSFYLIDGISILLLALGIFAMAELFDLFLKGKATIAAPEAVRIGRRDLFQGIKDVFHHWWLWLRCTVIGYAIGVIPGIGGAVAIFICYGHGVQSSKHPEQFGKGRVEGVIAPEAGNNSAVGGALLTTLGFGIPGDSVMAIILGAFLIVGIIPGSEMLTERLELSSMLIIGVALANIIAAVICIPLISTLAKVTIIPFKYLFSILLVVVMAAAPSVSRNIVDIFVLIPLGVFGLCMKRFGFSLPCFILGFVLGGLFEHKLWLSLKIHGVLFFLSSPICLVFIAILIALFGYQPAKTALSKRFRRGTKKA
ncbi:MAG: tripartite tricarboxylate transporter permease [Deltaproteobacteria bacterium]|nr:MAG: tripartite tricarboxylate transporter permease [Deltaproteobacteria bacterium]